MKEHCDNQRIVVQHGEVTIQSNEKSFAYHINSGIGKAYFKILFICTRSLIYLDVIYFITFVILCRISENLTERKLRQVLFFIALHEAEFVHETALLKTKATVAL